jgi:hypothetical protein
MNSCYSRLVLAIVVIGCVSFGMVTGSIFYWKSKAIASPSDQETSWWVKLLKWSLFVAFGTIEGVGLFILFLMIVASSH